jgi:hypothetical protein
VVREHNIDKPLEFAQVEVTNIAYLGSTRSTNLSTSHTRTFSFSDHVHWHTSKLIINSQLENGGPKTRKPSLHHLKLKAKEKEMMMTLNLKKKT